jgi:hypothetical protein
MTSTLVLVLSPRLLEVLAQTLLAWRQSTVMAAKLFFATHATVVNILSFGSVTCATNNLVVLESI